VNTDTERSKTLKYYLNLKYPITIHNAPEGSFVAEIEDIPGCLAQGETLEEVYQEIEIVRKLWLETAYEDKQTILIPRDSRDYSGKFILRVPISLHRRLDSLANKEVTSLNRYVVSELSHIVGIAEGRAKYKNSNSPLSTR
jgi:antitoxin HicB